jgi:hypothetical protein
MFSSRVGTALRPSPPSSIDQLNHAIKRDTNPEIHNQPQVQPIGPMPSRRGQMGHQQKKIQKVPTNHGNGLFEQSSQHALSWTPEANDLMPSKSRSSLFALRFS